MNIFGALLVFLAMTAFQAKAYALCDVYTNYTDAEDEVNQNYCEGPAPNWHFDPNSATYSQGPNPDDNDTTIYVSFTCDSPNPAQFPNTVGTTDVAEFSAGRFRRTEPGNFMNRSHPISPIGAT